LRKLADFESEALHGDIEKSQPIEIHGEQANVPPYGDGKAQLHHYSGEGINLSYTINLNLPAATDIGVFNAIFKSLKEHLLQK
jgi:hypothetical protein